MWTHQKSLKFILEQQEIGVEYQKWAQKLLGYNFDIKFRPGSTNATADALSRHPTLALLQLAAISTATWVDWTALLEEISKDPILSPLRSTLDQGQRQQGGFTINQGRLLYNGGLVIPRTSHVVEKLLHRVSSHSFGRPQWGA